MKPLRIVLCGVSVLLGTLEVSLRRLPSHERITACPVPGRAESLAAPAPDIILFDAGTAPPQDAADFRTEFAQG